jgi:hypothetical protein
MLGMSLLLLVGSSMAAEYGVNPPPYPGSREQVGTFPAADPFCDRMELGLVGTADSDNFPLALDCIYWTSPREENPAAKWILTLDVVRDMILE